jgi:hypothetical protein
MSRAWEKRYGTAASRPERVTMVELFHTIGNAEDNASQTFIDQGWNKVVDLEERQRLMDEAFVASLYTDNLIVAKILAKFGFRF